MTDRNEPTLTLPARLGRYILLSRLTEGGMTEVYAAKLAEEVGPGRILVIKVLPKAAVDDPDAESRFLSEARIVLNLTHGNITAAFEFARDDEGRPFLVMEYVPGPSLRRLRAAAEKSGAPIDVADALFVTAEILKALSYAHSYSSGRRSRVGIIHRDISPDNIVISTSGQVKLTDFGIAEFTKARTGGPIFGKPAYIAPEIAAGTPPSTASDLYSVGAVLYECLTGRPPFKGETDKETLALSAATTPPPPSTLRSGIGGALDEVLSSLLDKDPSKRPTSAAALEVRLRAILQQTSPEYTEFQLAKTVSRFFNPAEFNLLESKEGLRASLIAAGVSLSGLETTDDLLAGGTIPLSEADAPKVAATLPKPFSRGLFAAFGGGAVLLAATMFFLLRPPPSLPVATDAPVTATDENPDRTADRRSDTPISKDTLSVVPPQPSTDASEDTATDTGLPSPSKTEKRAPFSSVRSQGAVKQHKKLGEDSGEWGWLNINSYPWSYVTVDGKRLEGHTPYRKVKLRKGAHTLVFENPELGLKAEEKVTVSPWEESNIGVRLK